jgi:hypothetical protein
MHAMAREMAARGQSVPAIARNLGMSCRTIYRFQALDVAEGLIWREMKPAARGVMSTGIIALLERRLGEALADNTLTPTQRADAVWKLNKTLQVERARADATKEAGDAVAPKPE